MTKGQLVLSALNRMPLTSSSRLIGSAGWRRG